MICCNVCVNVVYCCVLLCSWFDDQLLCSKGFADSLYSAIVFILMVDIKVTHYNLWMFGYMLENKIPQLDKCKTTKPVTREPQLLHLAKPGSSYLRDINAILKKM